MNNKEKKLSVKWFDQWIQTDSYLASDNHINRIPLRLTSSNIVIYGEATLSEVLKEFEHEDHHPITVGGKVPVQLWCNNFVDTDCGPIDNVNPYIEIWYSFPVTPKSSKLDLPYENAYSYNVNAPGTLTWCHRVLCGVMARKTTKQVERPYTKQRSLFFLNLQLMPLTCSFFARPVCLVGR